MCGIFYTCLFGYKKLLKNCFDIGLGTMHTFCKSAMQSFQTCIAFYNRQKTFVKEQVLRITAPGPSEFFSKITKFLPLANFVKSCFSISEQSIRIEVQTAAKHRLRSTGGITMSIESNLQLSSVLHALYAKVNFGQF